MLKLTPILTLLLILLTSCAHTPPGATQHQVLSATLCESTSLVDASSNLSRLGFRVTRDDAAGVLRSDEVSFDRDQLQRGWQRRTMLGFMAVTEERGIRWSVSRTRFGRRGISSDWVDLRMFSGPDLLFLRSLVCGTGDVTAGM